MPSPTQGPTRSVPLVNLNADELDKARGIASYHPDARLRQSTGLVGETAARDWVHRTYGSRAKPVTVLRRGTRGAPILDLVFEIGKGEYLVIEAKGNLSGEPGKVSLGRTRRRVWRSGPRGMRKTRGPKDIEQFSPRWFERRLEELRNRSPAGRKLANRLDHAWGQGKLRPVIVQAPYAAHSIDEVVVLDRTDQWNAHRGVTSALPPPTPSAPPVPPAPHAPPKPILDPQRALAAPPTDVERGIAAAEKVEPRAAETLAHAAEELPPPKAGAGAVRAAEQLAPRVVDTLGHGVRAGRALRIGVGAWRVARTIGKVAILCFVPLKALDIALEVALQLWDRQREKEERRARDKQRSLEAVFKESDRVQQAIQRAILANQAQQQAFLTDWDERPKANAFWYARLTATLEVVNLMNLANEELEGARSYKLVGLSVTATNWAHAFEISDGQPEQQEQTEADALRALEQGVYPAAVRKTAKRRTLKYTIVPPLVTPFDIVVAKINNLFLDLIQFIAYFSDMGETMKESFSGFDYKHDWEDQFGFALQYPRPLNEAKCRYCLGYLHWAAKTLSQHPLEQQDLEGNLEDPQKGWRRRFWLLQRVLEGPRRDNYNNFSHFAEALKRIAGPGSISSEISAAQNELYLGARVIWHDLHRVEAAMAKPESYYFGPDYRPPRD